MTPPQLIVRGTLAHQVCDLQLTSHWPTDRVNIANADVFGLSAELGLESFEYNTALVIFFVPYCLFEIPSNILLKRFKPHVWLSANMFMFGFVTIMMGIVRSYGGLLACRFFLGVFETGMFPGGMCQFAISVIASFSLTCLFLCSVLPYRHVVPSQRSAKTILVLLQQYYPRRSLWWSLGRGHRQDGWSTWLRWLALDFHS